MLASRLLSPVTVTNATGQQRPADSGSYFYYCGQFLRIKGIQRIQRIKKIQQFQKIEKIEKIEKIQEFEKIERRLSVCSNVIKYF